MRERLVRLGTVVATLLAVCSASAWPGPAAAAPGDFDYFLLSLSVAPSFCALSPANQAKDECRTLTAAAFQQTPLTVHGLWPNRIGVGVNRQPQDCAGPPLDRLPATVAADLRRLMPGGPGLMRYEWHKHGTCSGLAPESYFAAIARLAAQANETVGAVLRDQTQSSRPLRIAELQAAIGRRDPALAAAIVVDCKYPRGGGAAMVDEIRVVLSKEFAPLPASRVGIGQNSGCPQGQGTIPSPSP